MGDVLVAAGIAGLLLTAAAIPIAVILLRRQGRKLSQCIQQEYEE